MSNIESKPEVWQRGPVEGVPSLLQPAAHAILQAREEVIALMKDFPENSLWIKPAGMASAGFHLQHLSGVLDRLYTYARNEKLNPQQMQQLHDEAISSNENLNVRNLIERFNKQVDTAIVQLKSTDPSTLTEFRGIGRKQIPTTLIGLLFHAAEHTMRHLGQLIVTAKIIKEGKW